MPKNRLQRTIDLRSRASGGASIITGGGTVTGTTDHGALSGLADDDHTQYLNSTRGDARYPLNTLTLTAGAGLTGGGTLAADRTFTVGAGLGITVNADDVALTTPGTLTVATSNAASGSHTHAITTSSSPGAAASILASDSSGALGLQHLIAANYVRTPSLTSNAGLTLDAVSDLITIGASNNLRTFNYASQVTGWALDYNGSLDARYIYTDEMHAKAFIADLEQALAGGQIISKSVAVLAQDFTCPAASAADWLYVESLPSATGMDVFEAGDMIRLRVFSRAAGSLTIADCWGTVRKNAGEPIYSTNAEGKEVQQWHFTRSASTSGRAGTASGTIKRGTLVLDYGASGNGFYEVNAIDGAYAANSPYLQFVKWTTHPKDGSTVALRLGHLAGLSGRSANEYGLVYGDPSSTSAASAILSTATTEFRNLPMKWYASGSVFATVDTGGFDIVASTAYGWDRAYSMSNAAGAYGGLRGYSNPSGGDGNYTQLYASTANSLPPKCHIIADGTVTYPGSVYLAANGSNTAGNAYIQMLEGVTTLADDLIKLGDGISTSTVQINGAATLSSTLGVAGNVTLTGASPPLLVGSAAVTTGDAALAIGHSRTGNGNAYLDLRGDTTYSAGFRIIRNTTGAPNASTQIIHRGTGNFIIEAQEAANFFIQTSDTTRLTILSTGEVGIGKTPTSGWELDVNGDIAASGVVNATLRAVAGTAPSSSADSGGSTGDIRFDASYLYYKSASGWRRCTGASW
jgi:hypothetical protein